MTKVLLAIMVAVVGCGKSQDISQPEVQEDIEVLSLHDAALKSSESRNGGYGIYVGSTLFSLDLAMRNVHQDPYAPPAGFSLRPEEIETVNYLLQPVANQDVRDIVMTKLGEMRARTLELDQMFPVEYLIEVMSRYVWINHPELACLDVNDDDSPYRSKVQVAYRHHANIRFCRDYQYLDDANKAALIVHEIVYAALSEKSVLLDFVGYLFSRDFEDFSRPSQNEFRRLTDTLTTYFVDAFDYVLLAEEGNLSADVLDQWNTSLSICFGKIRDPQEIRFAIWEKPEDAACVKSFQKTNENILPLTVDATGNVLLDELIVGAIDLGQMQLQSLCTDEFEALCQVQFTDLNWSLQKLIPAADIHAAATVGAIERVAYLIRQGTDINALDLQMNTPLMLAVENEHLELIEWLLEAGADFHIANANGDWPGRIALEKENPDIVGLLADRGEDFNTDNPLAEFISASRYYLEHNLAMMKAVMRSPTIDPNKGSNWPDTFMWAPVRFVAAYIEAGRPRGLTIAAGCSVQMAVRRRNPQLIQLLLDTPEVIPNACDPIGKALEEENVNMVVLETLLDDPRIDVSGPSLWDRTPLRLSLDKAPVFFDMILARNPDLEVEMVSSGGRTRIWHHVVATRDVSKIEALVEAGVDVNSFAYLHDRIGELNALLYSMLRGGYAPEIYDLLVSVGVEVDPDTDGRKPLCYILEHGVDDWEKKARWLEDHGAECDE